MSARESYKRCARCDTWHRNPDALDESSGAAFCRNREECTRTIRTRIEATDVTRNGVKA